MTPDIITFDKSLQQRHDEFIAVLGTRGLSIPASRILNEWRSNVELILEPAGWQAVWKVSRKKCEELSIAFPTIIMVEVEDVDFSTLVASVKVMAVQDNISIPDRVDVALQQLFPTKQQTNLHLDVEGTADCLDQLRFFYLYVWYPWDIDEGDTGDWVQEHLEVRLRLQYDLRAGTMLRSTGEYICSLIKEGRKVQADINALLEDVEANDDVLDDVIAADLMQLELRKEQIKTEVEMLENPRMRDLMIHKRLQTAVCKRRHNNGNAKEVCLVWLGGTLSDFNTFQQQAAVCVEGNAFVTVVRLLQGALDEAISGDTVLLSGGKHHLARLGGLDAGGTLRGISCPLPATLTPPHPAPLLLDCHPSPTTPLCLVNLTLDVRDVQTVLIVRGGIVRMTGCNVVGGEGDATRQGVLVLGGGRLEADGCHFTGLGTAVVGNAGAVVSMDNCTIDKCHFGFQMNEDAVLTLKNCNVVGCKENGIRIEACDEASDLNVSSSGVTFLTNGKLNTNIKLEATVIKESAQQDVIIMKKSQDDLMNYDNLLKSYLAIV